MSIPTREDFIAEALKQANEKYDRMADKQRREDLFSFTGKECTYLSPSFKGSLQIVHFEVTSIGEAHEIYKKLETVKIYTQHNSTVSTDCLEPAEKEGKHSYQYDIQIRIDTNRHMEKNIMTFVAFVDKEYYHIHIKFNSDLFKVNGRREEFVGGYIIKDCTLTSYINDQGPLTEVGRILWGSDSTFYKTASAFYNVKK